MDVSETLKQVFSESSISPESIKCLDNLTYKYAFNAFLSGSFSEAHNSLSPIEEHAEGISVLLGIDEHEDFLKCVHWGSILTLIRLLSELNNDDSSFTIYVTFMNENRYFSEFMSLLVRHESLSSSEVRKELGNISEKTFYRFVSKTLPEKFYYRQKVGSVNFYSITPIGKTYYNRYNSKNNLHLSREDFEWISELLKLYTDILIRRDLSSSNFRNLLLKLRQSFPDSRWNEQSLFIESALNSITSSLKEKLRKQLSGDDSIQKRDTDFHYYVPSRTSENEDDIYDGDDFF